MRDPLPDAASRAQLKIVCVGNPWRGDDAVGLDVARRLRGTLPAGSDLHEREGEPTALIDAWEGAQLLWLVDAVSSGAPAGTIHRLDASERELPAELFRASTHHVGLAEGRDVSLRDLSRRLPRAPITVKSLFHRGLVGYGASWDEANELARALGRLPARTVIYGIEGESFEIGRELTLAVATAAARVAEAVREEVVECTKKR